MTKPTRPKLVSAKSPDADEYWLLQGATLVRRTDGALATVIRTLSLEVPNEEVRIVEPEGEMDRVG
jgi:hypothetical protein